MERMTNEQYNEVLSTRWGWLCEDIADKSVRFNTMMLLENSYGNMVKEGQVTSKWLEENVLNEGTEQLNEAPASTYSTFDKSQVIPRVLFPIIRRVMPNLFTNKLVSTQPIDARTGVVYYIDYKYSNSKNGHTAGQKYTGANLDLDGDGNTTAVPSYYSNHKFGPFVGTTDANGALTGATLVTDVHGKIIPFFDEFSLLAGADAEAKSEDFLVKYTDWAHKGFDSAGVRAGGKGFTAYINGSRVPTVEALLQFVSGGAAGEVDISTTGNAGSLYGLKKIMIFWHYEQESTAYMPEMEFSVESENVETQERKLKIRWTKESEQDMQRYHKIDVESELVKIASMEQAYETDREVLDFIENIVPSQLDKLHVWGNDPLSVPGTSVPGTLAPDFTTALVSNNVDTIQGTSGNFLDRHRLLSQKMFELGALSAQYNRLGVPSWAVVGPQMGAVLRQLPGFEGDIFTNNSMKIQELGELNNGSMQIYCDINRPSGRADEILMGYKSNTSEYGAGVVYAPYIQWMSDTVTNPQNFDSIRGFFSRYGIHKIRRGQYYYSRLKIANLNFL